MGRKVTLARESSITDLTNVRSFASMSSFMDSQRRPLTESFRALVALVRFLSGVYSPVHAQIFRISESLAADITDIRLLARVDSPVLFEMLGAAQTLATEITKVQFRRVVTLLVSEKRPLGSENSAADIARSAGYLVGLDFRVKTSAVRRKLSPQTESATADLTVEGFLPRVDVVMLLKVDGFSKSFVAVGALEGQLCLVRVAEHVDAQGCKHGGLVVALLAHVAREEMRLFVSREVAKQAELFGTVLAREVAHCVTQQMLLVVALVAEHLVAGLAHELLLAFVGLGALTLSVCVLLHVLAKAHRRPKHATAL